MSIRNLDYLFKPKSIALVGASTRPGSVGAVLARNLLRGGFDGPVMPVNPKHRVVESVQAYANVELLPETPDLAVIATPPRTVPGIVEQLAARGTRAAIVVTAGFGESAGGAGRELQERMLQAARPHLLRVVGPNCLGVLVPGRGINASFAQLQPRPGTIAFVTQSGAIATAVLGWAHARGIGFSHVVSLGDMADVDFGDMLDYLASDPRARAILLYMEAVTHTRKFMSAARAAARTKPVIVVKAGRRPEGARAAATHTGALAGADAVFEAAFRRAGMLRVLGLRELFDAVEIVANLAAPDGDRLAILTNGGGMGVLAVDALVDAGGKLAGLAPDTLAGLDRVLPATWSRANPVDIIGDAPPERYRDALALLRADPNVDAVLAVNCPTAVASSVAAAQAVCEVAAQPGPAVLASWTGEAGEANRLFAERRIAAFDTPEEAVRGFMYLADYRRNQTLLTQTPPSIPEAFSPEVERARKAIDAALAEGREWLAQQEADEVLSAYGIPVVETRLAGSPEEAARAAAGIGGPVVLKIRSAQITHKSDVGGVVLALEGAEAVRQQAQAMLGRVAAARPDAKVDGFSVQPMVRRGSAFELIVGATVDPQFGPVILFGHGGTAVELTGDTALGLPPLNMHLARELVSRTRVARLLGGYRDVPPADLDAIALTLIKAAQLVSDFAEIVELDINPLLASEKGVLGLDARLRVARAAGSPVDRLALRPYPKALEEDVPLGDGRVLLLRPVVPEDEPALHAGFATLTEEEIRQRFHAPMKTLGHVMAARFTQLDYDREMALILTERGVPGKTPIYAVVRLMADPDNEQAEYAIIVYRAMTGMGLGVFLMRRIIEYARSRGIREIWGDVLRDNTTMLKLSAALGFTREAAAEGGVVRVRLRL